MFACVHAAWKHVDLSKSKAYPSDVWSANPRITGCDWVTGGYRGIYFANHDGHIYELYQSYNDPPDKWAYADLMTKVPSAPPMKMPGPIQAFEWTAGKSKQVVYPAVDGNLYELSVAVNGNWGAVPLTGPNSQSNAPAPQL